MISTKVSSPLLFAPLLAIPVAIPIVLGAPTATLAQALVLQVSNTTNAALTELYISPTSVDTWEDNHLSGSIGPNAQRSIKISDFDRGCSYDVLGIFADGDEVEEYELDFCSTNAYGFQTFQFQNFTNMSLVELHVSPSSSDNWQQNRLGEGAAVRAGAAPVVVKLGANGNGPSCLYDVLGVFATGSEDGNQIEEYEVDFCEIEIYTFFEPEPSSIESEPLPEGTTI
jgi:hypothetical protein